MNILLVNYEYPPLGGGGAVAIRDVARELAKRHRVHVLTSRGPGLPAQETFDDRDLTIFRSKVFQRRQRAVASIASMLCFYPFGISLGRRLIKTYAYDVINTWFAIPSGPTGTHLAARGSIPHVLTVIGGDIYDPSKWYSPHRNPMLKRIVRSVIRKADGHTAISQDVADRTDHIYGFKGPVEVIPLGVDPPAFPPASRQMLGLDSDHLYVVTVGRLVRRKDHHTLLKALKLLANPKVHLLILGDGPERENLHASAEQLGIGGQIHFMGFVAEDQKYQLLACSDVFSLTSLHEGFGLVYIEAMHCGLPVIAADTGGQTDFLSDGQTGGLVRPGDANALSRVLQGLMEDPHRRRQIGSANKALAQRYTVANTAQKYEGLFSRVAERG